MRKVKRNKFNDGEGKKKDEIAISGIRAMAFTDSHSHKTTLAKYDSNDIHSHKTAVAKVIPGRRKVSMNNLVNAMDLDEMLEASTAVERYFKGEKIPSVQSPKAQRYVKIVTDLNKNAATKYAAESMVQNLNGHIVEKNRKTVNLAEAKKLYQTLMKDK